VPPVCFPDGRTYLKVGGNLRSDPRLPGETDLIDWFRSTGDRVEAEALEASLRALLPRAEFTSFVTSPCVVTGTPSGYPYLGWVDDGVAVAIGGNGSAAKSSDEIGRLAASLFSPDGWTDSLDATLFEPRFVS
jgi:sarcosine oxidase